MLYNYIRKNNFHAFSAHKNIFNTKTWITVSWFFLHVASLMNVSLLILAAMPVNLFVFYVVKMLFYLCTCSHAEFGYFQVQRNCHCRSLLMPWDCYFSLLLAFQHSMDAFGYLNKRRKPSLILKVNCRRCHHCASRMALMLRAYFIVETMTILWGNFNSDSYGYKGCMYMSFLIAQIVCELLSPLQN